MQEKWIVSAKKADFQGIGAHFGIDPVVARLIRNRNLTELSDIEVYLHGGAEALHSPYLLKDAKKAADILLESIRQQKKIRIIGDYDVDGVQSTYILLVALLRLGAQVDAAIPDRILDGYGLNEHLVSKAKEDGIQLIVTCDNGISAKEQVQLAREYGIRVIVTDHHEVPFVEEDGVRREVLPPADAIVNPKQEACHYPFPGLCGAAVAFKVVQVLYEAAGIPMEEADAFYENVGFATVADVMELQGENRIFVSLGLEALQKTKNKGMRALILQKNLGDKQLKSYHIGFVLGPCINASGRLETAQLSLKLLLCDDEKEAAVLAQEIVELNESRKLLTEHALKQALEFIEKNGYGKDKVLLVYLPDCHESLAGIVAGRVRETYHRPTFVVTNGEEGCKGSGRSVEAYSMYEEMSACKEFFTKFGGHPMAAGFSLPQENIDPLRKALNERTTLTEEQLIPRITIDVPMPVSYIYPELIKQLELLEPFGKGNEKPVFADRQLEIVQLKKLGREGRVVRMKLKTSDGMQLDAIYFGDCEKLRLSLEEKYGKLITNDVMDGRTTHGVTLDFLYYPELDTYYNIPRVQLKILGFRP